MLGLRMADKDPTAVNLVIAQITPGYVASYGQIAALAGYPGRARWVGKLLAQLPADSSLPWHRVVNSVGVIRAPRADIARQRLLDEGVVVKDGRIDMKRFGWMRDA
jgi:methylated-DNA-protein-cysteine methyltransferase related protein